MSFSAGEIAGMMEDYEIELKIWRGNAYNERGEEQLIDYLEHFVYFL